MRVLVTGADGFVGRHLCRFFEESGDAVIPLAGGGVGLTVTPTVDVRNRVALAESVARAKPDAVIHLAALSSVAESQRDPIGTFEVNTLGTANLCEAVREAVPEAAVLLISSGEVYGAVPAGQAATEAWPLVPASPYGASKVAAEVVAVQFARSYGMRVVVARPFSHIGAGQSPRFSIASFARQVADLRGAVGRGVLRVGNLEAVRDFSHVRDVVSAYRLLVERGAPGEAYNVGSGVGRSVKNVLDELITLAGVDVEIQVDPARFRPADIPNLVGDSTKLRALGWSPRHPLSEALVDLLSESNDHRGVA